MTIAVTAIVDLDEREDLTMKIEMVSPKLSVSAFHVADERRGEVEPSPEEAREYSVIALDHVLSFLAKGARENRDGIGSAPTQAAPEGRPS